MLGVQTINKLYSRLDVQTLNKLVIILDRMQINNHQLNCTANANTSNNYHHLKKVIVGEHCFITNVVLKLLQIAIHSQQPVDDNLKSKAKNFPLVVVTTRS